jgi:hypothetical protein
MLRWLEVSSACLPACARVGGRTHTCWLTKERATAPPSCMPCWLCPRHPCLHLATTTAPPPPQVLTFSPPGGGLLLAGKPGKAAASEAGDMARLYQQRISKLQQELQELEVEVHKERTRWGLGAAAAAA